jgi:cystathionine beta-lyase
MRAYLAEHIPQLQVVPPQGTYLAWVNCSGLGLTPEARKLFFLEQAKLILDEGELFGPEGAGFERFNLACPRSILEEALERLKTAVAAL